MEMNTVDGKRFNTDGPKFTKRVWKPCCKKNSFLRRFIFRGESNPEKEATRWLLTTFFSVMYVLDFSLNKNTKAQ